MNAKLHPSIAAGMAAWLATSTSQTTDSAHEEHPGDRPAAPAQTPAAATMQQVQEQSRAAADWRVLRDAYYSHHRRCEVCIAAGKGYGKRCGAGLALWASYESATPPAPFLRGARRIGGRG